MDMKKFITIMVVLIGFSCSVSSQDFEKQAPAGFDTPSEPV